MSKVQSSEKEDQTPSLLLGSIGARGFFGGARGKSRLSKVNSLLGSLDSTSVTPIPNWNFSSSSSLGSVGSGSARCV